MAATDCEDLPGYVAVTGADGILTCVPVGQSPGSVTATWQQTGYILPLDWKILAAIGIGLLLIMKR